MKKITLMVSRYTHRGGLEKMARNLAKGFAAKGCLVTILTTEGKKSERDNIRVLPLAKRSKIALYQMIHFDLLCKRWLSKNRQDLVFGLERTTSQDLFRAGMGVHKVYLERRQKVQPNALLALNPLHRAIASYQKRAFEEPRLKLLFTNSHMVKEEILHNFAINPNKIEVVHNGIAHALFEKPFQESSFAPKERCRFLFVGNGYRRKGLGLLLPALAALPEKEWCLRVVGKDREECHFREITTKLQIDDQVEFCGEQKELIPYYQKADVLLLPSLYDPFANVTLEALSMGLFVVSSRFNGGSEILTPNLGSVIEDLFDRESIICALQEGFLADKSKKSAEIRREAMKEFSFSHKLDKIVAKSLASL